MPRTWWEIPTSLIDERTDEAAAQFGRMMCHIWHFEFETIVHLPFMLRTGSDRRYEYNRISCLIASRNLIMRWMFIRSAYGRTLFSNLTEFHAFTSAITLLLGLLGSTPTDPVALKERHEDLQLVETVVQIFEGMKQFNTGLNVVSQSISVIRTLQGIIRDEGNSSRNLRLEIPHFGTISIARGGAVQSLEGERILGANPRSQATSMQAQAPLQALRSNPIPPPSATGPTWPSMTVSNNQSYQDNNDNGQVIDGNGAWLPNTAVQFTSNQFPTFEAQNMDNTTAWPFQETNMMFFDSLLNTDVAGNWDI
jgi:hypothetical protein